MINNGLAWDVIKGIRDPFEIGANRFNKILYLAPCIGFVFFIIGYSILVRFDFFDLGDV
jgi:hypothetical protein